VEHKKKTEQKIILKLIPNILFICAVIVMVVWTSLITYNWNIFVKLFFLRQMNNVGQVILLKN